MAPALITVLTPDDDAGTVTQIDANTYTATTLRAAITQANQLSVLNPFNPPTNVINFAPAVAGQTIVAAGNDPFAAPFGQTAFGIRGKLTIVGDADKGVTISGNNTHRIFGIFGGSLVTLQNLTLTGGNVTGGAGGNGGGGGGGGAGLGGAIYSYQATLVAFNCLFQGNTATGGIGGTGAVGSGGSLVTGGGGGASASYDGGALDPTWTTGGGGGGVQGKGNGANGLGGANDLGVQATADQTPTAGGGGGGGIAGSWVAHSGAPATSTNSVGLGGGGGGGAGDDNSDFGLAKGGAGGFGAGGGGGGEGGIGLTGNNGGQGGFGGGGGGGGGPTSNDGGGSGGAGGFGGGAGGSQTRTGYGEGGSGGGGAGFGGALFIYGGRLELSNCTLTGNSAVAGPYNQPPGGGFGQVGTGLGAAVFIYNSQNVIGNCTLADNNSSNYVWDDDGHLNLVSSGDHSVYILAQGKGKTASAYFANSIVSSSGSSQGPDVAFFSLNGARLPTVSGVNNFISNPGAVPRSAVVGTGDPKLLSLADNGGPTLTFLPMPGSPVIDAGHNNPRRDLRLTDQRGLPRLTGAFVDIGAVENQESSSPFLRSVTVRNGSSQQAPKIVLTFSGPVTVTAGAFSLYQVAGSDPIPAQVQVYTSDGYTVVRLIFNSLKTAPLAGYKLLVRGEMLFDVNSDRLVALTQEIFLRLAGYRRPSA